MRLIPLRSTHQMKVITSRLLLYTFIHLVLAKHFNIQSCNDSLPKYHVNDPGYKIPTGCVDRYGQNTSIPQDIFSYTYDTCLEICGPGIDRTDYVHVIQQLTL